MSFTLSQCYFQSCSTAGNFVFINGEAVVGNFFAITSIVDYEASLALNQTTLSKEIPTDLPLEFTPVEDNQGIYLHNSNFREIGIQALRAAGAIEKQILPQ